MAEAQAGGRGLRINIVTRERWAQLQPLFHGALDQPGAEREAWLRAATSDESLRREVLALLRAHDTAGDFLEVPVQVHVPEVGTEVAGEGRRSLDGATQGTQAFTHVGPYRIEEEIGRGGMGIVYRATDTRLGRQVALKALPPGLARNEDRRERLRREARAAATLSHPGIATVYALEELDDHLFIASEYLPGRTLRETMQQGRIEVPRALTIASEIAAALAAAHDAGVIHRDLKSENIAVTRDGHPKILDFGIAHLADDTARLTMPGAAIGTPAYMAPEQLIGADVDFRVDIYALGVLLVEMITGAHPLSGAAEGLNPRISAIVERCLARDPARRFAAARQLEAALTGCAAQTAQTMSETVDPAKVGRSAPRWWWEFHQAVTASVYGLMMIPLWSARALIGSTAGRALFVLGLAAAIVAAILRLHLWFSSRFYASELTWGQRRASPVLVIADSVFAFSLVAMGWLVGDTREALAILLIAVGIGSAVAFLVIEPVTARAAFRDTSL